MSLFKPAQGYFVEIVSPGTPLHFAHALGGLTSIKGATSPNSKRPLLTLLTLDGTDPRLDLGAFTSALPLLYSWTCPISQGVFSYKFLPEKIEVIEYVDGDPYIDFPYRNYPESFPIRPVKLIPVTAHQQDLIASLNSRQEIASDGEVALAEIDIPRHQVGGEPRLMQRPLRNLKCCNCKEPMPIFASVANDSGTPSGFAGNDFVHVIYHLCRTCVLFSAYNMVD
jgi:hypothetical protein